MRERYKPMATVEINNFGTWNKREGFSVGIWLEAWAVRPFCHFAERL